MIPWYSEACSSTMATTYSSGSSGERKVITTDLHNGCTGTSASAPMAAGVLALVLEANPALTWRDVQHLTVRNAHVANLRDTDWRVNALGRYYSHSFGYGMMDAIGMVRDAQQWTTCRRCEVALEPAGGKACIPGSVQQLGGLPALLLLLQGLHWAQRLPGDQGPPPVHPPSTCPPPSTWPSSSTWPPPLSPVLILPRGRRHAGGRGRHRVP